MQLLFARPIRRYGCWGCGCAVVIVAVMALACLGLLMLVTGRVQAAPLNANPREVAVVIDQSGSIVNRVDNQALMRDLAQHAVERWRRNAGPDHTVRVLAFGARLTTVISSTSLSDPSLDSRLTRFFDQSTSLGGTAYVPVLSALLTDIPTGFDVILITDGVPDPAGDPAVYAGQLRDVSQQYAQRGIGTAVFLVGTAERALWLPMWRDFAQQTQGSMVEVKSADEITRAIEALPVIALTNTPAPLPTTPSPTPTSRPTLTPTSTPPPSPLPSPGPPPAPSSEPVIPWALMVLGGAWVVAMIDFVAMLLKSRATAPQPIKVTAGDDGVLEVLDPDHDAWQRIALHNMAVGEVWLIGHAEHCQIRLDEVADEVAAIVMTPDGPQIDSRGTPLVVDGQFVHSHRLFDNDEVYIGRLIVLYQNFFRQRPTDEAEGEAAQPLQSLMSSFQRPTSNPGRSA